MLDRCPLALVVVGASPPLSWRAALALRSGSVLARNPLRTAAGAAALVTALRNNGGRASALFKSININIHKKLYFYINFIIRGSLVD
jgi:hypothetical protein